MGPPMSQIHCRHVDSSFQLKVCIRYAYHGSGIVALLALYSFCFARCRRVDHDGEAIKVETFATALDRPFGIAFYPEDNSKYI